MHRALWALLSRFLPNWRQHLTIVQPDTVVRWHRAGWRLYWRWKSKPGPGRPMVPLKVRNLIRQMSLENRLWGAPRIHGELLKLGYDICESTIAKYMIRNPGPSVQTRRSMIARSRVNPYSAAYTIGIFATQHKKVIRQTAAVHGSVCLVSKFGIKPADILLNLQSKQSHSLT